MLNIYFYLTYFQVVNWLESSDLLIGSFDSYLLKIGHTFFFTAKFFLKWKQKYIWVPNSKL